MKNFGLTTFSTNTLTTELLKDIVQHIMKGCKFVTANSRKLGHWSDHPHVAQKTSEKCMHSFWQILGSILLSYFHYVEAQPLVDECSISTLHMISWHLNSILVAVFIGTNFLQSISA